MAGREPPRQVRLTQERIPAVVTDVAVSRDGPVVGRDRADLGRFAVQGPGAEMGRDPDLPVGVELMLQDGAPADLDQAFRPVRRQRQQPRAEPGAEQHRVA